MLQHLHNGWQVDQAILSEEDRVVVSKFSSLINQFFGEIDSCFPSCHNITGNIPIQQPDVETQFAPIYSVLMILYFTMLCCNGILSL